MACNENVIKNMANEITRNCNWQNVTIDPEFVTYMIDLLLLNPKYGKRFAKTINRNNLAYFVDECGSMVMRGGTSLSILKMQYVLQTNYDKLQSLIENRMETIDKCLSPLVNEILEMDPNPEDEPEFQKLFRKISIYFILASGLGNPGNIVTLKEGMAALESVFSMEELMSFLALSRKEKTQQLKVLMSYTAGVRLFNRDCKKGGEGIQDLPMNLVDAGNACMALLSNTLVTVMQVVNKLTSAIDDVVAVEDETCNIVIDTSKHSGVTVEHYKEIFDLLTFHRQYEVYIRKLLADVESITLQGSQYVACTKTVLADLHAAVKYKTAVPVVNVFANARQSGSQYCNVRVRFKIESQILRYKLQPLFTKLWEKWRAMQNIMYLISTVNRLVAIIANIHEQITMPHELIDKLLTGKTVITDQARISIRPTTEERLTLASLSNYMCVGSSNTELLGVKQREFLGFCALCLCVGALVPGNVKIGLIKSNGCYYSFCNVKMATQFSSDPERYVNEVLHHARNNPHLINLLNIVDHVYSVKDIDELIVIRVPKIKVFNKDIQTETHPIDSYKEKNYHWDLWEWKRRACQWANIVNCKTHSTQTHYSHLRSEIQCQTTEPRDVCLQTNKDVGINTVNTKICLWGLRAKPGYGYHAMDLTLPHASVAMQPQEMAACVEKASSIFRSEFSEEQMDFFGYEQDLNNSKKE